MAEKGLGSSMRLLQLRGLRPSLGHVRFLAPALMALALLLSACGGNVTTGTGGSTPGAVVIGNRGTLLPGVLSWGEDSTGGMPYIVPGDASNPGVQYYGFEVDIANAMTKLMGLANQPSQITYSNWPQGLQSQQFDMFMNGLEITPENAKSATFSIPYYVYTQSIVVLSTNTTINSFADLAGKNVETGTSYKAEFIMQDFNKNASNKINIFTTDNPTPFADLLSGRVDAMFIDTPIAEWYGAHDPSGKFKTAGPPIDPGYYGVAFSPTNPNTPVLKKEINAAIAQMWLDGTLKKIYQDGGAFNTNANNQPVAQKYDMWTDSEPCIGNFLPTNPTHVANCPPLTPS